MGTEHLLITLLLVICGANLYAGLHYAAIGLSRPYSRTHLLFSALCLGFGIQGLLTTAMFTAQDVMHYVTLLRWNLNLGALNSMLQLAFVCSYAERWSPRLLAFFAAPLLLAVVANQYFPYSLQLAAQPELYAHILPWGEALTRPAGPTSPWFLLALLPYSAVLLYCAWALTLFHYRTRSWASLGIWLSNALFVVMAIHGVLVRAGVFEGLPLGTFLSVVVPLVMTVALGYELRLKDQRLRAILDHVPAQVYMKDLQGRYLMANRQWQKQLASAGIPEGLGKTDAELFPPERARNYVNHDQQVIASRSALEFEELGSNPKEVRTNLTIKFPILNGRGLPVAVCGISSDITQRKADEERIRHLAYHDQLTGLPNRRLLRERLEQAHFVQQHRAGRCALLIVDLDNFKAINDILGPRLGDQLLQEMARRLTASVGDTYTVAHLSGDEFAVLLTGLPTLHDEALAQVEQVCARIHTSLGQPYQLAGHTHSTSCRIGVVLSDETVPSADELQNRANMAMHEAKAAGGNTTLFFDARMQQDLTSRARLEAELRLGLEQEQFTLFYQPQIDHQGSVIGAECLLRWLHPTHGLIAPGAFIGLAEETGLILPLGDWVLKAACQQLAAWQARPLTRDLVLAVNVSARQFLQQDFADTVLQTLAEAGAPAHRLKIELTESVLLSHVEGTIARMMLLKSHGVQFALDDFGTGYSSLAYLKRLPLDQLKIDRSFVHDILHDPNSWAIVQAIVGLAHSLRLDVMAEGVEEAGQRNELAALGCLAYQGYLLGRPMPVEDFERLLVEAPAV